MRAHAVLALISLIILTALPGATAAESDEGIGITPPSVEVRDAQPGQSYERRVNVQNSANRTMTITMEPGGEVGNWTTTRPGGDFQIPPRTFDTAVALNITVPADAYVGDHRGQMCFTADARDAPEGSGSSIRASICVVMNVTVGGDPVVRLDWVDARAEDVEVGTPPQVAARVTNAGNVKSTATVRAEVLRMDGDDVLMEAAATRALVPGRTVDVALPFTESLPEGQYRARVTAESANGTALDETVHFKVVPPGALGKEGRLRYIQHEPWVDAGRPVKVTAVFENTGRVAVAQAKFKGEVLLDGDLVDVLESDALVVAVGRLANLTAFFTPDAPGTYTIVGTVLYDGFETPASESILNVQGDAAEGGAPWPLIGGLGLAGALGAGYAVWRKRARGGE